MASNRPIFKPRKFCPEWREPYLTWSQAYLRVNYWRVQYLFTYDEALQECALTFARCLKRCEARGGRIDNPKWFMAFFKRAVINQFNIHAAKDGRAREAAATYALQHRADHAEQEGPLVSALASTSDELQQILAVIAKAPPRLLELLLSSASEERWSRRLCRLCQTATINASVIRELKILLEA